MSKKGDHPYLRRLLKVADRRNPFQAQAAHLRHQHQWLIDLDRLMDLEQHPKSTQKSVSQAVDQYLRELLDQVEQSREADDQAAAHQINQILRNLWWGLFACYEVEGLPRTNNDLEQFIRRIKMGQRRISGRKNVQDFVLRYGSFVAFVDYAESEEALRERLAQVSQEAFLQERNTLNMIIVKEQKIHRFRCNRQVFLTDLETRWQAVVSSDHL
jgi:hypothetical protein